jgi:c-di-GMP-binding flagellar brake protein YcgR
MADPVKKPTVSGRRNVRRTPRRAYVRPVGILSHGSYEVQRGLQLSEGGMLFQSAKDFKAKQQIVATLIIPNGGTVVARGEVIYVNNVNNVNNVNKTKSGGEPHYGIKFSGLSLQLRRLIRNFVSAKTQEEAEAERFDEA